MATFAMIAAAGATVIPLLFFAASLLYALLGMAQSVVGTGLPGRRAGLDALTQRVKCLSNVDGAAGGSPITVTGISLNDTILAVIAGDGTDLGAADISISAANTILCTVSTSSKKLTVIWIDETSAAPSRGTEYDPVFGTLDDLFGIRLRASVVAGANGALTLTGLATTDTVLGLWLTDGTADLSASTWAVTSNTLTPTPSIDTSGKSVVVLWIDHSASTGGNGHDQNTAIGLHNAAGFNALIRGLRISSAAGPNMAGDITAGSYATIAEDDNILGVFYSAAATDPLDGAWTVKAGGGGVSYAGAENLSAGIVYTLWWDRSAAGIAA
ncbi:MAG: hypothetical protein AB7S36_12825 [Planctomycetota bacterium]